MSTLLEAQELSLQDVKANYSGVSPCWNGRNIRKPTAAGAVSQEG